MTAIRFPSPSKHTNEESFFNSVYRWMTRITGAELYRHFKTREVIPDAEELASWLREQSWPKIKKYVADYQAHAGKGMWSGEAYERQLDRAVSFCLSTYDPETIHARAVSGGQRSKRSPSFTLAQFRALPEGLTVAEQMALLGCKSPQTVYALRRALRAYDPVLAGEFDSPNLARVASSNPKPHSPAMRTSGPSFR